MNIKYIGIFVFIISIYFLLFRTESVSLRPGIKIFEQPIQTETDIDMFQYKGKYTIIPVKNYEIKAKVLSVERYDSSPVADLSSLDLALGWGKMSDQDVVDSMKIWQNGRWYFYQLYSDSLLPMNEVITSSANTHIISDNKKVQKQLNDIIKGEIINLKGYLVNVEKKNNWSWNTSITRKDSGNGSCEVMYVEEVKILEK